MAVTAGCWKMHGAGVSPGHGGGESEPAPLHESAAKPCLLNRAGDAGCPLLSVPPYPGVDPSHGGRGRAECSGERFQTCLLQAYFQR